MFQSQRPSSVGSSRRHRGFQPDEVNKNRDKIVSVNLSPAQTPHNMKDLPATAPAMANKLGSTMSLRSTEPLAPHRRNPTEDQSSNHHIFDHAQVVESETSSVQIITTRKPSCWSIASQPKTPPTEWDSSAANIDRPLTTILPVYHFPRPKNTKEREDISKSFSRQKAHLTSQTILSTSKMPKPHEMNESPRLAPPGQDEVQVTARIASGKDGRATDSSHRLNQLQHDAQLDIEQASKLNTDKEEMLARTVQASSGVQTQCEHTQDIPQARQLDVKKTTMGPSVESSQAKFNEVSAPLEKQSAPTPPHLRVQSRIHGADDKDKSLPPHLRSAASQFTTTVTKATAHDERVEPGKQKASKIQDAKVPPHRQALSAAKSQAAQGPRSGSILSPMSQAKDDSNRRTIDIDEEIVATQPILDIDEEIVAGLNAETSDTILVAQHTDINARETNEQVLYIPPKARAAFSRGNAATAESKSRSTDKIARPQANKHAKGNHSTNTRSHGLASEPHAGGLQDVPCKRKNANLASASKESALPNVPNNAESSVKKGKKPAREFESVEHTSDLAGWDGKMKPPPVGDEWDRRQPFNPQSNERHSVIEAWREEHAADPEENNRMVVNTASSDFQTGEGLAGGDVNVLSPINKMDHETHTPDDDFTRARRHRNAAEAMEDYKAKIATKPKTVSSGIDGMTKEERRSLRRALIEAERSTVIPPNPHAPAANVYLRPAELRDMNQIMNIYNHDIHKASFVPHLDPVDEMYWYVYSPSESAPNPDHLRDWKNCFGSKVLL